TRALTAEVRRLLTVRSQGFFLGFLSASAAAPMFLMASASARPIHGPTAAVILGSAVTSSLVLAMVLAGPPPAPGLKPGSTPLPLTGIFAALLIGCCVGPNVLMGIVYDPAYRGPIDAGDLGKCVSIFHVLAIVFAGTHTATEINAGSTALSFLTQKSRWASLV